MRPDRTPRRDALVSLRSLVIVTLAVIVAVAAGTLSYLSDGDVPRALLVAGAAFGGTCVFFHQVVQ